MPSRDIERCVASRTGGSGGRPCPILSGAISGNQALSWPYLGEILDLIATIFAVMSAIQCVLGLPTWTRGYPSDRRCLYGPTNIFWKIYYVHILSTSERLICIS